MCWRDSLSDREWHEQFESGMNRIRNTKTLRIQDAYKHCEVRPSVDSSDQNQPDRRYFRRRYWQKIQGPTDTVEIRLLDGTIVKFTELPEEILKGYGLRSKNPHAKVTIHNDMIGFMFGNIGTKIYYPLLFENDFFRFTVLSLPRRSSQRA